MSGSCFVLVLKAVGTLKDGRRPLSSKLRLPSLPCPSWDIPALALGGYSCQFSQGKLSFSLGTNQVLCPGSMRGLVIIVGLTQLRIIWQESLNELPRAGWSEGTSVEDSLVNGGGRTILNVGSTISQSIS